VAELFGELAAVEPVAVGVLHGPDHAQEERGARVPRLRRAVRAFLRPRNLEVQEGPRLELAGEQQADPAAKNVEDPGRRALARGGEGGGADGLDAAGEPYPAPAVPQRRPDALRPEDAQLGRAQLGGERAADDP